MRSKSSPTPASPATAELVAALLSWFSEVRRDLPWRRARDPYATWVSEIMLQQTRVEAVVPYFETWMQAFPDVASLARADLDEVLRHWSGLGYYRRARLLHQAAQQLVAAGDGSLPTDSLSLRQLPGIGEYTSAAIASISFGEAVPVVDGNVKRVAARMLALDLAADDRALHKQAQAWGSLLMADLGQESRSGKRADIGRVNKPGDLNEALMELGATVCTARTPACAACPIAHCCPSKGEAALRRPRPAAKIQWRKLQLVFALGQTDAGVLLIQRESGWNPGLWEPPSMVWSAKAELEEQWSATLPGRLGAPLGQLRHTITNHKITAEVFQLQDWDGAGAVDPSTLPLTGLAKKILRAFRS